MQIRLLQTTYMSYNTEVNKLA